MRRTDTTFNILSSHLAPRFLLVYLLDISVKNDHLKFSIMRRIRKLTYQDIFNNYSLKSRWIVAKYSQSHYSPRLKRIIVLVYTHEVISAKSERKPLKSTIWLTDQITRKFENISLQNFQTWQFTSLLFRKQQRNGLNGTLKVWTVSLPEKKSRTLLFSVDSPSL